MIESLDWQDMAALSDWAAEMLKVCSLPLAKAVLDKAKDQAAGAVLDGLKNKAAGVWGWLKARLASDPAATKMLESFQQDPQARQADLAVELKKRLEFEDGFLDAVRPMLEELRQLQSQLAAKGVSIQFASQQTGDVGPGGTVIQVQAKNADIRHHGGSAR